MSFRVLQEEEPAPPLWQTIYVSVVLVIMFIVLFNDRFGTDAVMMGTMTAMLVPGIITVQEALAGFSNSGLWTVMILFVIAEAISKTGAFGWYMTKLLGFPKSIASAQLRLMLPITTLSAFLNNSPIVVVTIPIVQQWAENARLDIQQLLIPLSWATILGGTITLIGTSTNLIIVSLIEKAYPDNPPIGMFDQAIYGVPNALVGLSYILLISPLILGRSGKQVPTSDEPILLGARVTPWSPAAGRSIQRSGLRDTGGIYLVSVVRAQTGHVHRAVSGQFILNVGDVLYFTGLVESFGAFCSEHGLEVVTNESDAVSDSMSVTQAEDVVVKIPPQDHGSKKPYLHGSWEIIPEESDFPLGSTKDSLLQASHYERLRALSVMADLIRGYTPPSEAEMMPLTSKSPNHAMGSDPHQIVVANESDLICVGINCTDRPGLLLDVSKGLLQLNLQLRNTEASVVGNRSVSIWRCEYILTESLKTIDPGEIWSVLLTIVFPNSDVQAIKKRGLRVIRACVTKDSRLINKTATEVDFRTWYGAAIVAVQQQKGHEEGHELTTISSDLTSVRFRQGDLLILQASDDSPLLKKPPKDFYSSKVTSTSHPALQSRVSDLFSGLLGRAPHESAETGQDGANEEGVVADAEFDAEKNLQEIHRATAQEQEEELAAWHDLQVLSRQTGDQDGESEQLVAAAPEFLTAMKVSEKAGWIGKTVKQVGIHNLPNLVLVSIERETYTIELDLSKHAGSVQTGSSNREVKTLQTLPHERPLEAGDILWFSGPASSIGDLRKIPGLVSYEHDEVKKLKEKVHERRLVQAVVSRKGPLVGKTVKELRFRTHYGAAVISVQREGKRVHELPGTIKLRAGDVLLLEAGPSFLGQSPQNDISFALLSEVKNSAPPRLSMLIPTLIIVITALAVSIAGLTTLLVSMLVATILLICIGALSEQEARQALNWVIFLTIGAAFGIGSGLVNSGVAGAVADFIVRIGAGVGLEGAGVIAAVYFTTFLICNVLTNNATAVLVFPIAMDAASQVGISPTLMGFALMLAASASFMSPYSYTTNLLIFGPGKYKYKDFLLFGTPLQIVLWICATAIVSVRPWYISWIASGALFFLVAFVRVGYDVLIQSFSKDGTVGKYQQDLPKKNYEEVSI